MNLTHLIMFQFWAGASEFEALLNIGRMKLTLTKLVTCQSTLVKQTQLKVTLGVEA